MQYMPIEERIASSDSSDITHECKVFHIDGHPVACIIDKNQQNKHRYELFSENSDLGENLTPTVGESTELGWIMILNISIRTLDDKMDFTILPDDEFIEVLINNSEIIIVDDYKKPMFVFGLKDIDKVSQLKQKLFELRQD